jgi:hypothetical protein
VEVNRLRRSLEVTRDFDDNDGGEKRGEEGGKLSWGKGKGV